MLTQPNMLGKSFYERQDHAVLNAPTPHQLGGCGLRQYPLNNQLHHLSDWRKDPHITRRRGLVRRKIAEIFKHKVQHTMELEQRASNFAIDLENRLFVEAASKEEYVNWEILQRRMKKLVQQGMRKRNPSQTNHLSSSPCSGMKPAVGDCWKSDVPSLSFSYSQCSGTTYCNGMTNSSGHFTGRMVQSPQQASSTITHSSGGEFTGSGVIENGPGFFWSSLKRTSSESLNEHLQQQYLHQDGEVSLVSSRGCVENVQNCASDVYLSTLEQRVEPSASYFQDSHHVQERNSVIQNIFPSLIPDMQSETLEDALRPFLQFNRPKPQSQCYLVKQFGSCTQMNENNESNLPQPSEEQINIFPSMVSESQSSSLENVLQSQSSVLKFQGGHNAYIWQEIGNSESLATMKLLLKELHGASGNSAFPSGILGDQFQSSIDHEILLAYVSSKNSGSPVAENKASYINHLHSMLCEKFACRCENYGMLLSHFDDCRYAGCHICGPVSHKKLNQVEDLLPSDNNNGGPNSNHVAGILRPLKRRKMENPSGNGIAEKLTAQIVQACAPEELPSLVQWSESPLSITSEVKDANIEPLTNVIQDGEHLGHNPVTLISEKVPISHEDNNCDHMLEQRDSTDVNETSENAVDDSSRLRLQSVPRASENPDADHKEEVPIHNCDHMLEQRNSTDVNVTSENAMDDSSRLRLKSVPHASENPDADHNEEVHANFEEDRLVLKNDLSMPQPEHGEGWKSDNQNINGASLIESFSAVEIKEHVSSLRQWTQDRGENTSINIVNENTCQLCLADRLPFAPTPIYCAVCSLCIKRSVQYYCTPNENGIQHCFCTKCYREVRGKSLSVNGFTVPKKNLCKRKNDEETDEPWVQCDTCKGWQHQICALYNVKSDLEGKATYICPNCCLQETETQQRTPLPETAVFSAKNLPSTVLSDHLEQRLFKRLKEDRRERAKVAGNNLDEVPEAKDLVVRVVLSVDKIVTVKKQFLDIFQDQGYPEEFQYRSKAILLFQKTEGADVCLFSMYVQEYGSECSHPNHRCVYISYLDSIKYFRPNILTATGEALRTFVYHEILIGYLEYCKKQGFVTCYIWACPPVKGEDYILYCHPQIQKTPKSDKLRQWYQSLLRKAAKEKVVVDFTNLYDHFFVPTGEWKTKITAARIPYFDGDYWSTCVERWIRDIDKECGGDSQQVTKLMKNRALKAMGLKNPSASAAKDILIMQKLGNSILPTKEDFIVVHLQYVCTQCHEVILSGLPWCCNQCTNFQLCERCHDSRECDTHSLNDKEEHLLYQAKVDDVPSDTKDKDVILANSLFENRHGFLSFCQKNHYQFDTLRRAKHSTMMILHELHDPTVLFVGSTCSMCRKVSMVDKSWICETCPKFSVCASCHLERGSSCHMHKLMPHSSKPARKTETKEETKELQQKVSTVRMGEFVDLIQHASQCRQKQSNQCSYPFCDKVKLMFTHASKCSRRSAGGCEICKRVWWGLRAHSKNCTDRDCNVPRCKILKNIAKRSALNGPPLEKQ